VYAPCSFAIGAVAHSRLITDFAKIWVWVSVALWLIVSAAMVGRVGKSA